MPSWALAAIDSLRFHIIMMKRKKLCCAGLIYWVDVIMGFVTGFVVIYNLRRRVIREPTSIAEYYVRYGTFLPDFLASLPTIAEVCSTHSQIPAQPLFRMHAHISTAEYYIRYGTFVPDLLTPQPTTAEAGPSLIGHHASKRPLFRSIKAT